MKSYFFDTVLLPGGWARNVQLSVTPAGEIAEVCADARRGDSTHIAGVALPGMPNLHSHAFQRALAGLAEFRAHPSDSFWSWRKLMYEFVGQITAEQLQAIAAQLYLEMLKAGYTSVAEFHYVHHDASGRPYADVATMSHAIVAAAQLTGIGLTHLPVLYMSSGFGEQTATEGQRRFTHADVHSFLELVQKLQQAYGSDPQVSIGVAPHSLRAVPAAALLEVTSAFSQMDTNAPIHIHIAEQVKEVEDCVAHTGLRPVEWLLNNLQLDRRWCLVHATHLTEAETVRLAGSEAIAGLCPTTEANLGDGLFPLAPFLDSSGRIGVGSDSNSSVSPIEELRWLEYGQRLISRRRNIAADGTTPHVGRNLWQRCCNGGAQALGKLTGSIESGYRADLVVLDPEHPILAGRLQDQLLDCFVFSGNSNPITDVITGGKRVIENGRHLHEQGIVNSFRAAIRAASL
ncbi:MAG: formimidoylglutamate deiminase [Gammaproteobacteria bacterium]|nr:formimidoylglutamate deiminase [Gammaproteobacteria bacterium]